MTILVTGAAGLLGTELCKQLLAQGEIVIAVDNYYTGSKSNIDQFFGRNGYYFIEQDIKIPLHDYQLIREFEPLTQIYNLACPASPVHYQSNAWNTLMTNIEGVVNMLSVAEQADARLLQASTSEVYGDPLEHPQKETYWGNVNTLGPRCLLYTSPSPRDS